MLFEFICIFGGISLLIFLVVLVLCISLRLMEEKLAMQSRCEESVAVKAEEVEQARLELLKAQQELLLSENKVRLLPTQL